MNVRIIPRLDIKGPNLVKGIHLEGLRVLGKPEHFARYYYENGADELIFMDAVASLYGRNSLTPIIEKTAKEIFVPLTVGGGLRSVEDIRAVLRSGADKVALNTAALARPELIREAALCFGSSTIVVSVEAIGKPDGGWEAYANYGRDKTGIDAVQWACRAEELGAGEIMVTSIDREGTAKGFDLDLTRKIADAVSLPVIACGGAGLVDHIWEAVELGHADAVAVASVLHYGFAPIYQYEEGHYAEEGNIEFLRGARHYSKIQPTTIQEVKKHLSARGFDCRLEKDLVISHD